MLYPSTVLTLQLGPPSSRPIFPHAEMELRSEEGLPVTLLFSMQYKLQPEKLAFFNGVIDRVGRSCHDEQLRVNIRGRLVGE